MAALYLRKRYFQEFEENAVSNVRFYLKIYKYFTSKLNIIYILYFILNKQERKLYGFCESTRYKYIFIKMTQIKG